MPSPFLYMLSRRPLKKTLRLGKSFIAYSISQIQPSGASMRPIWMPVSVS